MKKVAGGQDFSEVRPLTEEGWEGGAGGAAGGFSIR